LNHVFAFGSRGVISVIAVLPIFGTPQVNHKWTNPMASSKVYGAINGRKA
jgi:hypothetical protein